MTPQDLTPMEVSTWLLDGPLVELGMLAVVAAGLLVAVMMAVVARVTQGCERKET